MSYDEQIWINGPGGGTPRSAARFNHMEAGIKEASDRAARLELGAVTAVGVDYAPSLALNAQEGGLFRIAAAGDLALNDITGGVDGQEITVEIRAVGADRVLTIAGQDPVTIPAGGKLAARFRFNEDDDEWLFSIDGGGSGGGAVDSVNGQTGVVVLDADDVADGSTKVVMTTAERTKLGGVASGATANASNAQLRDRATHTGEQSIATVTGLQTALDDLAAAGTSGTLLYARGINMAGGEFGHDAAHLPGTYGVDYAYPTLAELTAMAERDPGLVRIPMRLERLFTAPTSPAWRSAERTRINQVVADARAAGFERIRIEPAHNYARWIVSGGATLVLGQDWPVAGLVDMWELLSTEFKDQSDVEYDLMNEPHDLVAVSGGFTGTTRYDWSDGVQGWTGDAATASVVSGRLRLAGTATSGFFQFRKDDAGLKRGGTLSGNVLEAVVTLGAGITGSWRALLQWQNSSFSWQSAASTTYTRVDTGATVTGLIAGVAVRVRASHTAITSPNAFAIQIEANDATAGAVSADIDDFAQGSVTGGQTEAQVWESISAQIGDAIRANGDTNHISIPTYNFSSAKNVATIHPDGPWWDDPADNHSYQVHYYCDSDNSGDYPDSYATENTAAVALGYASLAARAVAEIGNATAWADAGGVKLFVGELGWPNTADTAQWNAVGQAIYNHLDAHNVDATYWATGGWWDPNYNLLAYSGTNLATAKAQAAVIEAHPTTYSDLTGQVADLEGRVTVLETSGVGGGAATQAAPYVGPAFMVIDAETSGELATAKTNGATHALVQVKWDQHQSSLGGAVDATTVLERIADATTAGLKVCLRVSPQYIPTFVDSGGVKFKRAGGTEHNPGNVSGYNVRDWVWSKSTRAMVEDFLGKLFDQLDWSKIERVQIGGGPAGELQFPLSDFTSDPNVPYWWAYSTPAQSGGSDLAPRMAACPVPGHVPSTGTTWTDNDEKFVGWYTQSLNNWMIWLIEQHRRYFSGPVYVMHPGFGLRRSSMTPTGSGALNYRMQVASGLDWAAQIGAYPDADCHPYSTWVDGTHPWDPAPYSDVNDGNAAAWLHLLRVARSLGRAGRIWGENTAINSGNDVMDRVFKEHAVAHGYEGITWLNHDGLANGSTDTYANFAARITEVVDAQIAHQPPATSSGGDGGAPTGTAGGVLTGTYPNPTFAVDMATQAELDTKTQVSVDGSAVATFAVDSTPITAADVGADPAGTAAAIVPPPSDHNMLAWSFDPAAVTGSTILTGGVIYLIRVRVPATTAVAGVAVHVSTAGATLANSFMGLYNASGTRLGLTADQSTGFAGGGLRSGTLTAPATVPAGKYYVAVLTNGTTQPTLTRAANSSAVNLGLAAPALRWATFGTGQTSLPSTINLSSSTASSLAFWAALV